MGLDISFYKIKKRELKYYRKVNFLVKFFEEKGMNVIDQQEYIIEKKDAEDLLDRCEASLKNHSAAPKLLPTMSGFFFGTTDYDEQYFETVVNVRDFVRDTLLPEFDKLQDDEYLTFDIWY